MEAISWSFVIAALIGGVGGKMGEKMSESAIAASQKFFSLLQTKSPDLAKKIEAAEDPSIIDAEMVEEVKLMAQSDPEMLAAGETISREMIQQFGGTAN